MMLDVLRLTALAHMLMAVQRPQSKAVLLMRWFTVGIKYVKKKVHFNEIIILKKILLLVLVLAIFWYFDL